MLVEKVIFPGNSRRLPMDWPLAIHTRQHFYGMVLMQSKAETSESVDYDRWTTRSFVNKGGTLSILAAFQLPGTFHNIHNEHRRER